MSCSQTKKGNLFDKQLPSTGPYSGSVEKVCADNNSTSRQFSSYSSNVRPDDREREALTRSLQNKSDGRSGGIFNGVANAIKSVFGSGSAPRDRDDDEHQQHQHQQHLLPHPPNASITLQDQDWPSPPYEEEDVVNSREQSAGRSVKRKRKSSVTRKRSGKSIKKRVKPGSKSVKKSVSRRKSVKKSVKRK